jgi:3-dehydroquinate synthase
VFELSSPRVRALHGAAVRAMLRTASRVVPLEAPDGEEAKSIEHATRLWRDMLAAGKRDSVLVAAGGGSVGDLGGFVAATFLRGIACVQVPTTLLAQVDAAIGGKTAIDLPEAKNSVGVFHPAHWIVADTTLLSTLDRDELRSGLFEVVKAGAILDRELVATLERECQRLLAADLDALAPAVARAAEIKIGVVAADPFETDRRRLLNFGHTLAHALETVLEYHGLRHGEAVGYGMLFALRLSLRRGLAPEEARRLARLIFALGLPPLPALLVKDLLAAMARDKKAREGGLSWVLLTELGSAEIVDGLEADLIETELWAFLKQPFELAP